MDHDLGRDLNLLNGLPDRTVHQTIRSTEPDRFAGGVGDIAGCAKTRNVYPNDATRMS